MLRVAEISFFFGGGSFSRGLCTEVTNDQLEMFVSSHCSTFVIRKFGKFPMEMGNAKVPSSKNDPQRCYESFFSFIQ